MLIFLQVRQSNLFVIYDFKKNISNGYFICVKLDTIRIFFDLLVIKWEKIRFNMGVGFEIFEVIEIDSEH